MSELEHGSSSSLGGAQSPEEAAEALRVFGEQQHSHSDVLQNSKMVKVMMTTPTKIYHVACAVKRTCLHLMQGVEMKTLSRAIGLRCVRSYDGLSA